MVMRHHLDFHKWKEAAFSTEQLRGQRWLIGSSPKSQGCPAELKRCLTVSEEAQTLHLRLVVASYVEAGRRLRASARPRMRLSTSQFDAYCDFACVYATALSDARLLSSWTDAKEQAVMKAFFQRFLVLKHLVLLHMFPFNLL